MTMFRDRQQPNVRNVTFVNVGFLYFRRNFLKIPALRRAQRRVPRTIYSTRPYNKQRTRQVSSIVAILQRDRRLHTRMWICLATCRWRRMFTNNGPVFWDGSEWGSTCWGASETVGILKFQFLKILKIYRGDVARDKHYDKLGFLPADPEYVRKAMQYFRGKYENVHFLLFGDDPKWNQQEIVDKNIHFNDAQVMPKRQTPGIDLCLLSKFVQISQFS